MDLMALCCGGGERSVRDLYIGVRAARSCGSHRAALALVAEEGLRDLDARGGGKRRRERDGVR
jgi:hypothetical protein